MSLPARLLLGLLLLGLAAAAGWRLGVKATRADWLAAEQARQAAEIEAANEDRRRAARAGERYEADRARLAAALESARHAVRSALDAPLQCPPHATLADLVVPASALAGLRAAAGDGEARPAAAGAGQAMPAGPGDSGR